VLSQRMRRGDGDAAFSLLQRQRALRGIEKRGSGWRLLLANNARHRKRQQCLLVAAIAVERQKPEARGPVLSPNALSALRARYGTGAVGGDYRDGECRPVLPGETCPACSWRWGNREPHVIAVR
jgi:hypothetical protein